MSDRTRSPATGPSTWPKLVQKGLVTLPRGLRAVARHGRRGVAAVTQRSLALLSATMERTTPAVPRERRPLAADYDLGRRIGEGSYGIVRLARRLQDGAQVVIKEIPLLPLPAAHRKLALREAETLATFSHANIVHCHEARCHDGESLPASAPPCCCACMWPHRQAAHTMLLSPARCTPPWSSRIQTFSAS